MARTAISAKKLVGTPIRQQLLAKLSRGKVPTKSLAKTPKKRATSSRKPPPIRIIPYPTTSMKINSIKKLSDARYYLVKQDDGYNVVQFSVRGKEEKAVGYAPEW
jgi:hypothetical protein